jgi:hypothetical protein
MHQALVTARQSGNKIGQVLLSQNLVSADDLNAALTLQELIKTGDLTVELGTRALQDTIHSKRTVHESLAELGWSEHKNIGNTEVADILLESGCVDKSQLDQARWNAAQNGLPIGRNLVLTGAITPSTLGCALTALILLRDREINTTEAINALKEAVAIRGSIEEVLDLNIAVSPNHVRVGELLSQAGLLSDSDAMIAAEKALLHRRCIGQVLLEYRMVSPMVLDATLKLQNMIEQRSVTRSQAVALLRQVAEQKVGLENFLTEMSFLKSKVLDLLLMSEVITRSELEQALRQSPEYETDMLRALFACNMLTQEVFRAAVRCSYAIDDGTYDKEDAIEWLHFTYVQEAREEEDEPVMLHTA